MRRERRRVPTNGGLSRILTSGSLSDDDAVLELHHVVIAGFIVWAELVAIRERAPLRSE